MFPRGTFSPMKTAKIWMMREDLGSDKHGTNANMDRLRTLMGADQRFRLRLVAELIINNETDTDFNKSSGKDEIFFKDGA